MHVTLTRGIDGLIPSVCIVWACEPALVQAKPGMHDVWTDWHASSGKHEFASMGPVCLLLHQSVEAGEF